MVSDVGMAGVDVTRLIQCDHFGSGVYNDFLEPACTAAHVKHPWAGDVLGPPPGRPPEMICIDRKPRLAIELGLAEFVPLIAEVISVVGPGDKSRNGIPNGVSMPTILLN